MVAMPQELDAIPEARCLKERVSGIDIYETEPGLLLCASGVGKVNAAMAAEILILRYGVRLIVNAGVAGCTQDSLSLGTLVVASGFVQHDVDTTAIGDSPGWVSTVDTVEFPAYKPELCLKLLRSMGKAACIGRAATGDWFAQDGERLREVRRQFAPLILDMEAGAVAQVCYRNGVSVAAVKAVSDRVFKPEQLHEYSNCDSALRTLGGIVVPFTKNLMNEHGKEWFRWVSSTKS